VAQAQQKAQRNQAKRNIEIHKQPAAAQMVCITTWDNRNTPPAGRQERGAQLTVCLALRHPTPPCPPHELDLPAASKAGETMSKSIIIPFLESGRAELERAALAVPEDKLAWKPLGNGRTVLDLLGAAAQNPTMATGLLRGNLEYGPDLFARLAQERESWGRGHSLELLGHNLRELIGEIEKLSDEKLAEPLTLPMLGGGTMPLGTWLLMTYRSLMARTAQINYIQTLYGDFERH
jgi:hypothetical protein